MEKMIELTTLTDDLRAQIALWKFRAVAALALALGFAFLLLCFGIGEFFF